MSKSLETRVRKLMDRMGDPNSVEVRARAMSDEELSARLRQLMLEDGYDPTLPHAEAQARYIEKLEAELPSLGEQEQEWQQQIIKHVKRDLDDLRLMFPESPSPAEVA